MKLKNVDKIICLHCIEDTKRYDNVIQSLYNLGGEDILEQTQISEFPKLNINTTIGNRLYEIKTWYYDNKSRINPDIYGGVFSCMYNWLILIGTAYHKGLNSILCIEDDIKFDCDIDEFNDYLNDIPHDANIIHFGYGWDEELSDVDHFNKHKHQKYIKLNKNYYITGTYGIYMDRKGMEYYLTYVQKYITCADQLYSRIDNILAVNMNITQYLCNKKIIIHDDYDSVIINND